MNCSICKRELDNPEDPLSENLGGDCAFCMLDAEVKIGDLNTAKGIAIDIATKIYNLKLKRQRS